MYEYRAFVKKVYDGDTITADIDLGFGITMKNQKIRLLNVNAPEVRGKERPQGLHTKQVVSDFILGKDIKIKTHKDKKGKYGRWLAEVWIDDTCINTWLINEGLAKPYRK